MTIHRKIPQKTDSQILPVTANISCQQDPPLWDHQRDGLASIPEQGGIYLNWDMGTGKSRVIVEAVNNRNPATTLIVCPKSVISVWVREFEKYGNGVAAIFPLVRGTAKQKLDDLHQHNLEDPKRPLVVVVNYETIWLKPIASAFRKQHWDLIVADEIHRIKAAWGKASVYMSRLYGKCKVGLSGTPMPHSPLDLWGQLRFVDPSILGPSFTRFRASVAIMGGFRRNGKPVQIIGFKNLDRLTRYFDSISNRVNKQSVLDLPPVIHERRDIELPGSARIVYKNMEDHLRVLLQNKEITATNGLVKVLRLAQISSGFLGTEELHDAKIRETCRLLEDIGMKPSVIWCRFRSDIARLRTAITDRPVHELSGNMNEQQTWNERPENSGAVLLTQYQAGGVGVDLSNASHAIYFSPTFSLGDYWQSIGRLDRPGQKNKVTCIHLTASDTIDETIYDALEKKAAIIYCVLEGLTNGN
tara:strand:+ start:4042 stop:5457 length:1416 start_codon:yes stop_codon:yes gene_type:complete